MHTGLPVMGVVPVADMLGEDEEETRYGKWLSEHSIISCRSRGASR
jgi:hypothetical protein